MCQLRIGSTRYSPAIKRKTGVMQKCTLNVGVVIDPPYTLKDYPSVLTTDTSERRVQKWGLDFELFHQIFVNILRCSLNYTEIRTYDESYEMLDQGTFDILLVRESVRVLYSYLTSSVVASPIVTRDSLVVYYKQLYRNAAAHIFDRVGTPAIIIVLLFTMFVHILMHFAKRYDETKKQFIAVVWFVLISMLLSLFSNLMTVDLLTRSRVPVDSFVDMNDLADAWLSGECQAFGLATDVVDSLEVEGINMERNRWISKLQMANKKWPPKLFKSREDIAEQFVLGTGCQFIADYKSVSGLYLRQYNGISMNEMSGELGYMDAVYLINKMTVPPETRENIARVITSNSVGALSETISNLYYPKRMDTDDTEKSASRISVYKILEAIKFLLIGASLAGATVILEYLCSKWSVLHKS